jgi:Domain of unknown function (DUF4112)
VAQARGGDTNTEGPDERQLALAADERTLRVAETLARWLDDHYIDPLIGALLPGLGDFLGSALGLYPVVLAWRRRAPKALLARMLLNLAADAAGGSIPVLGDIWDFVFRAHARNLALLRARLSAGEVRGHWSDGLVIAGALLVLLAALAVPVIVAVGLWKLLSSRL